MSGRNYVLDGFMIPGLIGITGFRGYSQALGTFPIEHCMVWHRGIREQNGLWPEAFIILIQSLISSNDCGWWGQVEWSAS